MLLWRGSQKSFRQSFGSKHLIRFGWLSNRNSKEVCLHFFCFFLVCTVLLLKSFHTRRSFFLLTGRHYSLCELTHYFSMFKEFPIKICLLKSKKLRQLRQSNLPPLFARRRSASYWAKSEMQLGYRKKYETSFERNPSVIFSILHKSEQWPAQKWLLQPEKWM